MSAFWVAVGKLIYPLRREINYYIKAGTVAGPREKTTAPKSIYNLRLEGINGKEIPLSQYRGKKILFVNTASECGFTPQFNGLQKLWEKYGKGVVVIGLPSNDFDEQEPLDEAAIFNFCQKIYGITFPLTKKMVVTGEHQSEIFQWLTSKELNGWNDRDPNWNFCKYLVDEKGNLVNFFSHKLDPMNPKIISVLEQPVLF